MISILVTGANGQLGNELKKLAGNYDFNFIFTDIDELDLTDPEACCTAITEISPEYVINCAAYTAVDRAEEEPDLAFMVNRDVVGNLMDACGTNGARLIHISTDYVFPGDRPVPLKEEDPTGPKSVYGLSKLEGEKILRDNPDAMIIRTSWLYSTYGKNFVKSMISLMKEREELGVVFDQAGSPTYAEDLARAILEIIQKIDNGEKSFQSGIYHYANEGVCSWYDLAREVGVLTGSKCKVRPIETKEYPTPAPRPVYSVLNKNKIKTVYNIVIPHWCESLKKCIDNLS